jgi:hypothetical protein
VCFKSCKGGRDWGREKPLLSWVEGGRWRHVKYINDFWSIRSPSLSLPLSSSFLSCGTRGRTQGPHFPTTYSTTQLHLQPLKYFLCKALPQFWDVFIFLAYVIFIWLIVEVEHIHCMWEF